MKKTFFLVLALALFFVGLTSAPAKAQSPQSVIDSCLEFFPNVKELTAFATRFIMDDAASQQATQRIFDFEERVREGRRVAEAKLGEISQTRNREEKEQTAALEKTTQAPNMAMIMQMAQAAQRVPALSAELQAIAPRISAANTQMEKENARLLAEHRALAKKAPYNEIPKLESQITGGMASESELARNKALIAQINALTKAYYAQILPEWHAHIVIWHDTVRGQKPDLERLEAIEFEIQEATGQKKTSAVPLGLEPDWQSVVERLDVLRKITGYSGL